MSLSKIKRSLSIKQEGGFTLIEILLVVAILSVLLVVVFASLRPAQRLADTRDARRWNDVNQILTAIHECIVDEDGVTTTCTGSYTAGDTYEIVTGSTAAGCDDVCTGATSDTHCLALDTTLASYLGSIPTDPGGVASGHTEYQISIDSNGIVEITSCAAPGDTNAATISVSR